MTQKIYFNLDFISAIHVTMERESSYKWFEEVPSKPKTFLGIPFGKTEVIPAGWSDWKSGFDRKQSSYFDEYLWYRVDETDKKVFNKAHVSVHLGPKESVSMNFNSNQEALNWAEGIIIKSGKKLEAVIYE
jgi:hypothetical protein